MDNHLCRRQKIIRKNIRYQVQEKYLSYYNKTAKTKNVISLWLTWGLEVARNQCTHTTHYSLVSF